MINIDFFLYIYYRYVDFRMICLKGLMISIMLLDQDK